jgi:ribosomal protein L22
MVNNQATNENTQRLVKASARHLHIAPRKMRPVTNLLLGMNVNDAIVQLQHMPQSLKSTNSTSETLPLKH